jgi:hypothetical protein
LPQGGQSQGTKPYLSPNMGCILIGECVKPRDLSPGQVAAETLGLGGLVVGSIFLPEALGIAGPVVAAQTSTPIMLGIGEAGLESSAAAAGARTLMGLGPAWRSAFLKAINDPAQRLIVNLNGVVGESAGGMLASLARYGATARATPFQWEIAQLFASGRIGTATIMLGGEVVANPFAP